MSLRAMNSSTSDRRGTPNYQQEHVSPISPQTRQDTKGTWQSQGGTWGPYKHGTTARPLSFYRAISCFTRYISDLQRLACSLQNLLQGSPLLQCLDLAYLLLCQSSFLLLSEIMQTLKMQHGKRWCCLAAGGLCPSVGPCNLKEHCKQRNNPPVTQHSKSSHPWQPTHRLGERYLLTKCSFPHQGVFSNK